MDAFRRDILLYRGQVLLFLFAADQPDAGTGSNPAFRRIDVDVETGRVKGLLVIIKRFNELDCAFLGHFEFLITQGF